MIKNLAADIYRNHLKKAGMTEEEYTETFKKYYQSVVEAPFFCPENCEYLSITETEQNKHPDKPDHICLKYNTRVKHGSFHPMLIRCEGCLKDV